ncbi:regulator of G-protein signaling 22-like [Patiria miniata]|uniref:RGS domain-containing protein n=1 Tax=Patiria miniata TaxID=46514 RepID=A0A913ZX89_PATMI|nr:regulator of G-protein signaling 22-like [Patiria miniata]
MAALDTHLSWGPQGEQLGWDYPVPPVVTADDLEDFLATDELFVDYFNAFLQLPTFPEPLIFNKEKRGFEVVTSAKQALKEKIRSLIRSQQKPNPIYTATKRLMKSKLPLGAKMPSGPQYTEEDFDVKTSFMVQCLNKEQGIQWIKEERLPAFLQSDSYLEFRLAKLISQVEIATKDSDVPIHLYIDATYKPFAIEKPPVVEPPKVDEQGIAMRQMYVCMGEAHATQSKEWYSDVKMKSGTTTTNSVQPRSSDGFGSSRPASSRPLSSASVRPMSSMSGRPLSSSMSVWDQATADSGIGSPWRQDSFSTSNFDPTSLEDIPNSEKMFHSPPRLRSPPVWRPPIGDDSCMVAENVGKSFSGPVHVAPSGSKFKMVRGESLDEVEDEKLSTESGFDAESQQLNNSDNENDEDLPEMQPQPIRVSSLEDMANVVVSYAMKSAIGVVTEVSQDEIDAYIDENILRSLDVHSADLTEDALHDMEVILPAERKRPSILKNGLDVQDDWRTNSRISMATVGNDGAEEDSLFDSDNEQEPDEIKDPFFSKPRYSFDLSNKRGLDGFKRFLWGTTGEKIWNLWLDVDRGHMIDDKEVQQHFVGQLRDKYLKAGGICELPREILKSLGLEAPSKWTSMDKLAKLHPDVTAPLLLYWAPRFLMREMYTGSANSSSTTTNQIYHRQKLLNSSSSSNSTSSSTHPEPRTVTLLPLRPKTCWPRLRHSIALPTEQAANRSDKSPSPPQVRKTQRSKTLPSLPISSLMTSVTPKKPTHHSKTASPSTPRRITISIGSGIKPSPPRGSPKAVASRSMSKNVSGVAASGDTAPEVADQRDERFSVSGGISQERFGGSGGISQDRFGGSGGISQERSVTIGTEEIVGGQEQDTSHGRPNTPHKPKRPTSASSTSSSIASEESEFFGGNRMESLLEGLYHEKKAGGFFMAYLEKLDNPTLVNCLSCWHELQDYHALFYADVFDSFHLQRKAQAINSKYIVHCCFYDIECPPNVRAQIYREVAPPFEELFDGAEEHILEMLLKPWSEMKSSDTVLYNKIELISEERQLDAMNARQLKNLTRRGFIKERISTPDFMLDEDEEGKQEAYYQTLREKIPEDFRDYDYNKLIHNRLELEHFRKFLEDNYAITDLMCWMDIESFRRTPYLDANKRDTKAKDIKTKYLNKKYFFGPNSPATRPQQNLVMQAGGGWGKLLLDRPPDPILIEAQKYVRQRLERKWLPMFLQREDFQERQRPNIKMEDVVSDVMNAKKLRSMAIYRILEGRWVSSSRDIIAFRQALMNPVTCGHFRKFFSVKGDNLENDVLFWLEVQKFKDMYHSHTDDSMIQQKIQAILRCFIMSEISPSLHIDITPEMAEKIMDKRPREMGPYVFRESQMTVFKVLFQHWADFQKYRNTLSEEKMLFDLEKKKKRQRRREMEMRRLEEEKEARKGEDDQNSVDSKSLSRRFSVFAEFLDEGEDDEDYEGQEKVQWKYSDYMTALDREERLLNGDDRASSILSAIDSYTEEQNSQARSSRTLQSEQGTVSSDKGSKGRSKNRNKVESQAPDKAAKKKVTMSVPTKVEGQGSSKKSTNGKEALTNGHQKDKGKGRTTAVNGSRKR